MKRTSCIVLTAAVAIVTLSFAPSVAAISCGQIVGQPLYDTSESCESVPHIDRYLGTEVFSWKDHDYLVVNTGNELAIWNIDQPLLPTLVDESRFYVSNVGDSDYDLLNFSVCDDCRYGTATFKGGLLLFDLGDVETPYFRANSLHPGAISSGAGAFTFAHGGQQYVIAASFQEQCARGSSSLFTYDGLDPEDWVQLGCLAVDSVAPFVLGGYYVPGSESSYLYLADRTTRVRVYELTGTGVDLGFSYVSSPMTTVMTRSRPLAFDLDQGLALTATASGLKVWNISAPEDPQLLADHRGSTGAVAMLPPFVYAARIGFEDSSRSYYLSATNHLVPFDVEFWGAGQWWNDYPCARAYDAVFSPDGTALYVARYSVLQVVTMEDCFDLIRPSLDPESADN